MMNYSAVQPHTKQEAEVAFAQGTREQIGDALLGITYYVEDWRWVQNVCLDWLGRADSNLQWTAIQCLGHLATFHKTLDLAIVLPAMQAHLSDPALASVFYDALGDFAGVEDTSYFEQNWDELPYRLQDALIESGVFNSFGKRVRNRNFSATRKSETSGQVSHDQELFTRLKQQLDIDSSHNWNEYYDEQGRLLRLNLDNLGLVNLPAELWQLTSLQELDLSENQLSSLPTELGKLVKLESLALVENEFSILPAELGKLINLQELFLDGNRFSSLSCEIEQLTNLQTLDLSHNQLGSLPRELGKLINLLGLFLDNNQLNSLPIELGQLTNLRTLFLDDNQLSSLPTELRKLVNLQWLSLERNKLSTLPVELGKLTNLDTFHVGQNPHLRVPPPEIVQEGTSAVMAYLRGLI